MSLQRVVVVLATMAAMGRAIGQDETQGGISGGRDWEQDNFGIRDPRVHSQGVLDRSVAKNRYSAQVSKILLLQSACG